MVQAVSVLLSFVSHTTRGWRAEIQRGKINTPLVGIRKNLLCQN